jgi:hypothetical protein
VSDWKLLPQIYNTTSSTTSQASQNTSQHHTKPTCDPNNQNLRLHQIVYIHSHTSRFIHNRSLLPTLSIHHTHLAAKHCGSRRIIRLRSSIQVVNNPRIILLVRAREADRRGRLVCRSAYDVDLCAFLIFHYQSPLHVLQGGGWKRTYHVKLRAHTLTRRMQCDKFTSQKVLAGCNTLGDSDCLHAFVCDETVYAPF